MNLSLLISKIKSIPYIIKGWAKPSFAQVGEDQILNFYFQSIGIKHPSYLDIGANTPVYGSNTYFFYSRGSSGVCVEPHPDLYRDIRRKRPRDIVLNTGIGLSDISSADYYIFPKKFSGWNTFSKEEAEYRKANKQPYEKVIQMPLKPINAILRDHFTRVPDFISIDVEGLDFDILKSLDFDRYAPKALIVETLRMGDSNSAHKRTDIAAFLDTKGYTIYADTFVNTIFIKV